MTFGTCADARHLARFEPSGEGDRADDAGTLPSLVPEAPTSAGRMVRLAVAVAVGMLVLLGWSSTAAADEESPTPSTEQTTPLLGLDLKPVTQVLTPVIEPVGTTVETATAPVTSAVAPTVEATTTAVRPVVATVGGAAQPLAPAVAPVVQTVEPVLQPVVAPIIERVVAPVVNDVVAPVVAPTVNPVVAPVVDVIGDIPVRPVGGSDDGELIALVLDPIVDPAADLTTDSADGAPAPVAAAGIPSSTDAAPVARDTEAVVDTQAGTSTGESAGSTTFDGIIAPVATGSADLAAVVLAPIGSDGPDADSAPAGSSGLPGPSASLPDGAPCGGSSGASGGSFLIALAPNAASSVASCRPVPARATTAATPDGRPRPQPGFSPG